MGDGRRKRLLTKTDSRTNEEDYLSKPYPFIWRMRGKYFQEDWPISNGALSTNGTELEVRYYQKLEVLYGHEARNCDG